MDIVVGFHCEVISCNLVQQSVQHATAESSGSSTIVECSAYEMICRPRFWIEVSFSSGVCCCVNVIGVP